MKGHYLIMDNAPIHTAKVTGEIIEESGYKYIYLPPYSPELNPIEQFWSVVKSGVKREFIYLLSFFFKMEEDIDSWYLPFEMRCGTDLIAKLTLNNKTIINMIVHQLLGSDISNNAYISGSTEWADDKRSDAIYIPRNEVTGDLPPILVEVQNHVDQRFMLRLINYCVNVYERYEVLPVVLVFVVEKFSNTIFEESFIDISLFQKDKISRHIGTIIFGLMPLIFWKVTFIFLVYGHPFSLYIYL